MTVQWNWPKLELLYMFWSFYLVTDDKHIHYLQTLMKFKGSKQTDQLRVALRRIICQTKRSTRNLTGVEDIVLSLGSNDNCTIFFVGFKENSGFSNSRANIQPPNQICRSLPTKNRIFLSRANQRIILWRYFFDNRKHNVCFSFSLFWSHNLLSQAGECVHYNWKRPQISFSK